MRKTLQLSLAAAVLVTLSPFFQGCSTIAFAPAIAASFVQMGNRDLRGTSKYWSDIKRGQFYRTLHPVWLLEDPGPPEFSGWYAHKVRPIGFKQRQLSTLPVGTILRPNRIRYVSDGWNYFWYLYHAVVENGPRAGTEIQITQLLEPCGKIGDARGIDPAWLAPVQIGNSSGRD
jgi:hypothetical protein